MEEIPILGVVVGKGQVQIENNKVKTIKEQKIPTKIKEVKSFQDLQISIDSSSRISVIQQDFSMNSKGKKHGNKKKNIKGHLKN